MHDAGSQFAADSAEIRDVVQESVDERSRRMTRTWVNDHSWRLVDDDDVRILVKDFQRRRFGLDGGRHRLRQIYDDSIAGMHRKIGANVAPTHTHSSVSNELLDLRPGMIRQNRDEESIEALSGGFRCDGVLGHEILLSVVGADLKLGPYLFRVAPACLGRPSLFRPFCYAATLRRRGTRCGASGVDRCSQISIAIASGASTS